MLAAAANTVTRAGPFPIKHPQRQVGSQTQPCTNGQVPNHQDRRLFKPLDARPEMIAERLLPALRSLAPSE